MGLFRFGKSAKAQEMDFVLKSLQLAFENNYKDNATANLKKFEEMYEAAVQNNSLKAKEVKEYGQLLDDLKERLKNFDHKQPVQR